MWELDHQEGWRLKNWCFWTVMLEKSLGSPSDYKEIKAVNPKGNQSWIFTGRTDAEAEAPILWPPDMKSRLIWKDPLAGKDWRQEEKGTAEDEMAEWYHWQWIMSLSKLQEMVKDREAWRDAVHRVTKSQIWLSNWTSGMWGSENTWNLKPWLHQLAFWVFWLFWVFIATCGLSLVVVLGLLIVVASLLAEHGF